VCVLVADGINCNEETAHAFAFAGGEPYQVHVNDLRTGAEKLREYQLLAIPGGFSYGDDIASGKVLAVELAILGDELSEFVNRGRPIIGICNGFQVLVRTGLLPFHTFGVANAALGVNDSGRFECRWVELIVENGPSLFTKGLGRVQRLPVAHGEGRFHTDADSLAQIEQEGLIALRYAADGKSTQSYPANPNGSLHAIAGLSDSSGLILGLMPHPERFIRPLQYPNWRRTPNVEPSGLGIFTNAIKYITS
jgi:phosphoribosylformylglycinamidine synthase